MELTEKTVSTEEIFSGKIIDVHVDKAELVDGKIRTREVVEHPGGVCVAALTEKDELLFVRQFRYPFKEIVLELPAGKLDGKGEDPFEAIKRELKEETGCTGKDYVFLGNSYSSPGFCSEIIRLWACRIESYGEQQLDEGEFLNVERIPLEKAIEMVMNNEIPDGKTQTAILKAAKVWGRL